MSAFPCLHPNFPTSSSLLSFKIGASFYVDCCSIQIYSPKYVSTSFSAWIMLYVSMVDYFEFIFTLLKIMHICYRKKEKQYKTTAWDSSQWIITLAYVTWCLDKSTNIEKYKTKMRWFFYMSHIQAAFPFNAKSRISMHVENGNLYPPCLC